MDMELTTLIPGLVTSAFVIFLSTLGYFLRDKVHTALAQVTKVEDRQVKFEDKSNERFSKLDEKFDNKIVKLDDKVDGHVTEIKKELSGISVHMATSVQVQDNILKGIDRLEKQLDKKS